MTALALTPNGVGKQSLSTVFDEWFGNDLIFTNPIKKPLTNISEFDDHFRIELSVPGYQKSDLIMSIDNHVLEIKSKNSDEMVEDSSNYRLKEFSKFKFTRTFKLTDIIDYDKVSAKCDNGILEIVLPKIEEAKKRPPRQIQIK